MLRSYLKIDAKGENVVYKLNNYELDTDTRELRNKGLPQKIEPLIFNLLKFMMENPERVLDRNELISKVWPSRVVSDSALSASISAARHAIGDSGRLQSSIKTVSGSGYRFIASFTCTETNSTENDLKYLEPQERHELSDIDKTEPLNIPDKPSIAIMDFVDISRHQEASLLAFGLTSEVNATLARMPHLFIIARASSNNLSTLELSSKAIGERLGVRYLVYGKLEQVAKRVRVTLSIVDATQNTEIWSDHFDHALDDLFQVQDDITNAVVVATDAAIEVAEIERAFHIPTENLSAWENYHRGLWHIDRTTLNDVKIAKNFFKKAVSLDSRFARAYAGLSYAHTSTRLLGHTLIKETDEDMLKSVDYAQRCIDINEQEMVGYMCLGRATLSLNRTEQALLLLNQAIKLCPNSPHNLGIKAQAVTRLGDDYHLALQCLDTTDRLNPYSYFNKFNINMVRAIVLLYQKKYDKSLVIIEKAINYNIQYYLLFALAAACQELVGNHKKAHQHVLQVLTLLPNCTVDSCRRLMSCKEEPRKRLVTALISAGIPQSR
ncbi:MAG: winged helix-turn-helix domain-containing protein [Cocleimonas sp.]